MNLANVHWLALLVNWFPMLLLFSVWVFIVRQMRGGGFGGYQKRQAEALERIAAALEKRH
jgi:ATP-dependent Zn protease